MGDPGRPSSLTPECVESILAAYAVPTCTEKYAAVQSGISDRTLRRWLEQGRNELDAGSYTAHAEFYLRFERARGLRISGLLDTALHSAEASPATSARWVAQHLDPLSFAATQKHEVSGPEGGAMQLEHTARVVVLPPPADADASEDPNALRSEPRPTD